MTHWLTRYDPAEPLPEPYGTVCGCEIGRDHDGDGDPMFADETAATAEAPAVAADETPNP